MKKNITSALLAFSLLSFSQGPIPVENWWGYDIFHVTLPDDDPSFVNWNSNAYMCEGRVYFRVNWTLNPDDDPSTEFMEWSDIHHFAIEFSFIDVVTGNWVSDEFFISKNSFEQVGNSMRYTGDYPNSSFRSFSQNGLIFDLSVRIAAKIPVPGTDFFASLYSDIDLGQRSVRLCNLAQDNDQDGIIDDMDNCPFTPNSDQADNDNDGVGNACDNCLNSSNANQTDTDNDGLGNSCDEDDDNDGFLDINDNCPLYNNPDQSDVDGDGIGDSCDNCPSISNPNQVDSNNDGIGDQCQAKPDLVVSTNDVGITSECSDCPYILSELDEDEKHKITPNGILSINPAIIKNNTSTSAVSSKVKYFISPNLSSDDPSDDFDLPYETFIPAIPGNSSYAFTESIFGVHFPGLAFGDYKIIVKIDAENNVDEGNGETNNKFTIPIKWTSSTSGRFYLNLGTTTIEVPVDFSNATNEVVNLKIYSIDGLISVDGDYSINSNNASNSLLINQSISNDEIIDISYLPAGTYAIHINDKYLQKIYKKQSPRFTKN